MHSSQKYSQTYSSQTSGAPLRAILPGVFLCLALIVAAVVYWPGLGGPLVHDDMAQLSPLLDASRFDSVAWEGLLFSDSGPLGRPVAMATFLVNALVHGDDVAAWKGLNLVLHLVSTVLVFWLSAHLWCARRPVPNTRAWYVALLIAAAWAFHPLHVSTVLYTVQRMTQLSALFVLAGLLSYVLGRKQQLQGRSGYVSLGFCFLVCLPLATLSKENGVLLAPLALACEVFVFRFQGGVQARRTLAACFALFLAIPVLVGLALIGPRLEGLWVEGFLARGFTLTERLMTEFRVLFLYLFQLLVPIQQNMGFFHDDIVVSHGWLDPPSTLLSFLGIAALLAAAVAIRRRAPLAGFGIVFFFVAHALESTVVPLEIAYEHRNYLPSFGVLLAAGDALGRARFSRRAAAGLGVVMVVVLAVLTSFRVATWSAEFLLYNYAWRAHPESPRANALIAEQLTRAERYGQALALLEGHSGAGPTLQRLYVRCRRDGRLSDEAIASAAGALRAPVDHYVATGLMEVGRLGLTGGCQFSAAAYARLLETALGLRTVQPRTRHKLWIYRAHYLHAVGELEAAISALDSAHALVAHNPMPLFLATEWLMARGELKRARARYASAVQVADESHGSYRELIDDIGTRLTRLEGRGGEKARR